MEGRYDNVFLLIVQLPFSNPSPLLARLSPTLNAGHTHQWLVQPHLKLGHGFVVQSWPVGPDRSSVRKFLCIFPHNTKRCTRNNCSLYLDAVVWRYSVWSSSGHFATAWGWEQCWEWLNRKAELEFLYTLDIQFSRSVVSYSLPPHGLQHARPPCPSPTPGVYPHPCPLSQWCHPTISSSVVPSSSHLQSFPAIGSFQMSQLFAIGGQGIGVSASASVLPMNTQDWYPLGWTGWISLQSKTLKSLHHHSSKASILWCSAFFTVQLSYPYMTTGKTIALTRRAFADKVMSLLFNILSGLVITFLSRSKHLLISWLQSPSTVVLEPPKIKCNCYHCIPIYLPWSDGTGCHDLSFLNVEL